ncbi:MAG: diacylglycerol kinase family protein [Candidatus Moraniibacteriota bacterium]
MIRLGKSVYHALRGLRYVLRHERNFQIEIFVTEAVILLGVWLHLTRTEWIIIIFACFWVLAFELMNTAVERVVNVLKPSPHPYARVIKDVMAGAVFLSAVGAMIIGAILFLSYWRW